VYWYSLGDVIDVLVLYWLYARIDVASHYESGRAIRCIVGNKYDRTCAWRAPRSSVKFSDSNNQTIPCLLTPSQ
jgi:hypothetical protein